MRTTDHPPVVRGLASLADPVSVQTDPVSGLPSIVLGQRVTTAEVARALEVE